MPLKLATFNSPNVAILNKWADTVENTTTSHDKQLADLNGRIDQLLKANPSLVIPGAK